MNIEADYSRLLAQGTTVDSGDHTDPDAWRKAIRDRCRADRLKVRTGLSRYASERTGRRVAWAFLLKQAEDAQAAYDAYYAAETADDRRAAADRLRLLGLQTLEEAFGAMSEPPQDDDD